jgi:DNA-binding response OmpR family regulator
MNTHVVVVDQRATVVAGVVASLNKAGYAASGAHLFNDAVQLLKTTRPGILIVSIELGAYNGLHLALRCSLDLPATKVIVVGPPSKSFENEARSLGASTYVSRPVTAAGLVDQVHALALPDAAMLPAAAGLKATAIWA